MLAWMQSIERIVSHLTLNARRETLFAFRFGVETCRTLEPIWSLSGDQFFTMPHDGKTLFAANITRKKTEKAGKGYETAFMRKQTYDLGLELSKKNGGKIMNGLKPTQVYPELRTAYKSVGLDVEYFYIHPIHALRHVGAQWWLETTGWKRPVVARIGGWLAEKTLEDHYGGVPDDVFFGAVSMIL